ncbi:hypothetical protein Gasu2_48620 [Galdieria sulphuraria]|nr:hypothetical protein Gasu2_48620 [Galdieria sulphuraria]
MSQSFPVIQLAVPECPRNQRGAQPLRNLDLREPFQIISIYVCSIRLVTLISLHTIHADRDRGICHCFVANASDSQIHIQVGEIATIGCSLCSAPSCSKAFGTDESLTYGVCELSYPLLKTFLKSELSNTVVNALESYFGSSFLSDISKMESDVSSIKSVVDNVNTSLQDVLDTQDDIVSFVDDIATSSELEQNFSKLFQYLNELFTS